MPPQPAARHAACGPGGLTLGFCPMSFDSGFQALRRRLTSLCVNADPSVELLQSWGLPPGAAGLAAFVDTVLEAVRDTVAVVKPQSAFFEQFGPDGMAELQRLCSRLSQRGILVIADCKRGDVGHSMEAYARTWLGPDRAYAVSAMTLNPYLGFGALCPQSGWRQVRARPPSWL